MWESYAATGGGKTDPREDPDNPQQPPTTPEKAEKTNPEADKRSPTKGPFKGDGAFAQRSIGRRSTVNSQRSADEGMLM